MKNKKLKKFSKSNLVLRHIGPKIESPFELEGGIILRNCLYYIQKELDKCKVKYKLSEREQKILRIALGYYFSKTDDIGKA